MKHLTEDELILYFYGETRRAGHVDQHLSQCAECAAVYRDIAGTLTLVATPDTPERGEYYGEEVWQRIRQQLPEQEQVGWFAWMNWQRAAFAAAAVVLLVVAGAGQLWTARHPAAPAQAAMPVVDTRLAADATERVRLAAIGDHLEQSERVLLDVANAQGKSIDVSSQQAWAASLIDANRLYRDAALHAGDEDVASLLDELERGLLDIVHGPSTLTPAELDRALVRLDATTLLFKIRVLSDELRERELAPAKPRTTL
ncbi:MAG TPA: hypothetical protein VHZ73_05300 [Vicinamibacterales bacterium]|jgi:hypothetical protein|nr:hypothetical protein [Vicinamibacterales bacterium]